MNPPISDPHTPPRRPSHADRSPGPFSSPLTPTSSFSTPSTHVRNNEDPFASTESTPTHRPQQTRPTTLYALGVPGEESRSALFFENSDLSVQKVHQPDRARDFERPRRSQCTTLYDLIRAGLPQPPPYTKTHKSFLSSMKQFNKTEKTMASDPTTASDVLEEVVYAEGMLDYIIPIAREQLSSMKLDWDSEDHVDLINAVSPWNIRRILPPCINSEKEAEDWGVYANISPVLLVLDCVIHDDILPAPLDTPQVIPVEAPNVTSSDAEDGVVPDFIITDDEGSVRGVVEFKSEPILRPTDNSGARGNVFADLQDTHVLNGELSPGLPMKFVWPRYGEAEGREDTKTAQSSDTQTKLLIQARHSLI
ncbi:hypothetical protein NM688_g6713 [Phlebia brevispora]|uniref:Uncharacterized protein n=1 Tax=Phlebia brevispora TaxID=194682 RepID=A0ACC1SDQ6_9APHY|nr:hypothetical protein NM688_g6713 [Phlebia brevispora]